MDVVFREDHQLRTLGNKYFKENPKKALRIELNRLLQFKVERRLWMIHLFLHLVMMMVTMTWLMMVMMMWLMIRVCEDH